MELSETRKADRAKMVQKLIDLVQECGATPTKNGGPARRETVDIESERGLACYVDIDGDSMQPNIFVVPWYVGIKSEARLSESFPGDVNPLHRRKCTTVAYGFDELCDHVREVLTLAKSGEAFEA